MKALILSDTHAKLDNAQKVIDTLKDEIDIIIHLGDHDKDIEKLKTYNKVKYLVRGNCDYNSKTSELIIADFCNTKVYISHGHKEGVKSSLTNLLYSAKEKNCQIALFGHKHMIELSYSKDDILLFSPGSISYPKFYPNPSFGLIDFTESGYTPKLFEFTKNKISEIKSHL